MKPLFKIINEHGFRYITPLVNIVDPHVKGIVLNGFYLGSIACSKGHLLMLQKINGEVILVLIEEELLKKLIKHNFGELLSITCIEEASIENHYSKPIYSVVGLLNANCARHDIPNMISLDKYIPPKYTPPDPA